MANEAGAGCVVRATPQSGYTFVSEGEPASIGGSVTRLASYANPSVSTSALNFAFFTASGNNLTTVAGSRQTFQYGATGAQCYEKEAPGDFTAFSVSPGNYIGAYNQAATYYASSGGNGVWYYAGDGTDVSGQAFSLLSSGIDCLTADIEGIVGGNPWYHYAQQ